MAHMFLASVAFLCFVFCEGLIYPNEKPLQQKEQHQLSDSNCGGILTGTDSGEIKSPNYPGNYPNNATCEWQIIVPNDKVIHLKEITWQLELDYKCCLDRLRIIDDTYESTYCYGLHHYISTGNELTLVFESDGSLTYKGFNLTYKAVDPPADNSFGNGGNPGDGTCGPVYSAARVVGGNDVSIGEYPWMAQLRRDGKFQCGGTIITEKWVVSAAHCVKDKQDSFTVMVGGHHIYEDEIVIPVSRVIMHPDYGKHVHFSNDILLLELAQPITWSSLTAPACLSRQDPDVGLECVITGWGETEADRQDYYRQEYYLQEAEVPVLSDTDCGNAYASRFLDGMMCAGQDGIDTCHGDSGGPLVCKIDGSYVLHGVTSWGKGCAKANYPGVYTRVARYMDWMKNVTGLTLA